ncbi:MAG: hypothetical protein ACXVCI_14210 [Bdellovibrionota bacterium]
MPKGKAALTAAFFFLSACTSVNVAGPIPADGGKLKDQKPLLKEPSPDEDPKAPGMIPQECEMLLNRSREWGFVAGVNRWRPAKREDAMAAIAFFAGFHLVPESTSRFAAAWMHEHVPRTPIVAQRSLERMDRAQSCDLVLAHGMLLSLLKYRWKRADRAEVGRDFLQFVVNQQERVAPSMARAIHHDVLAKAAKRGLVKVSRKKVAALQRWYDEETSKGLASADATEENPIAEWKLAQEELRVSEEARARLGKLLP